MKKPKANFEEDFIQDRISDDWRAYLKNLPKPHFLCSDDLANTYIAVKAIQNTFENIESFDKRHSYGRYESKYYWHLKWQKHVLEYLIKQTNKNIKEELTDNRKIWREREK